MIQSLIYCCLHEDVRRWLIPCVVCCVVVLCWWFGGQYTDAKYKPSRFSIEETSGSAAAASGGRRAPVVVSDDEEDDPEDDKDETVDSPPPKTKTPVRAGGPAKRSTSEAAFTKTPTGPERNSNLAVGMALNRTFVMRGSKIGVFKHDSDDQLEYVNKIPVVKDLAGEIFSPAKAMLHQRDSKMLLLDASKQNTVFCMDLERGQVIEEWVCICPVLSCLSDFELWWCFGFYLLVAW